jgi:hypothetical protein
MGLERKQAIRGEHDQGTSWPEYSPHLRQGPPFIRDMLQHLVQKRRIETVIGIRQSLEVAPQDPIARDTRGAGPGHLIRLKLNSKRLEARLAECDDVLPGAAPAIQ